MPIFINNDDIYKIAIILCYSYNRSSLIFYRLSIKCICCDLASNIYTIKGIDFPISYLPVTTTTTSCPSYSIKSKTTKCSITPSIWISEVNKRNTTICMFFSNCVTLYIIWKIFIINNRKVIYSTSLRNRCNRFTFKC